LNRVVPQIPREMILFLTEGPKGVEEHLSFVPLLLAPHLNSTSLGVFSFG